MKPKDPTKNPDMKYETQVASQSQALGGRESSFPTPAHPTPRFLSRKGAVIALGFIALSFLVAFIIGGLSLAN